MDLESTFIEAVLRSPFVHVATLLIATVSFLVCMGVSFDRAQQRKATRGIKDEPLAEKPVFENLPNFRQAGGTHLCNQHGQKVKDGLLFRSSRTDFLTEEELDQFSKLGIKSIVDLRRNDEYFKSDGDKILDRFYKPCILKKGKIKEWKDPRRRGGLKKQSKQETTPPASIIGKRYLVNMMTMELIKAVFSQVNFLVRSFSLLLLVIDWFFNCHLFVRLYSHLVSNHQTLAEQYVGLLENAKPVVVDVMRLLLDSTNLPVLIHCAHGKDRTGVLVAVILGLLEVENEVIVQDYAMSEAGLASIKVRLFRETVGRYGFKEEFTRATAETMRDVLKEMTKRYGSVSGYLSSAGLSIEEQDTLKNIFLE